MTLDIMTENIKIQLHLLCHLLYHIGCMYERMNNNLVKWPWRGLYGFLQFLQKAPSAGDHVYLGIKLVVINTWLFRLTT